VYDVAHIGLVVSDLDRSKDFYCNILGCKLQSSHTSERFKIAFLLAGKQLIELIQYSMPDKAKRSAGVVDHIAFKVDDMDKALARLQSAGVTILEMPKAVLGDKRVMFFQGPDGERLEFIEE